MQQVRRVRLCQLRCNDGAVTEGGRLVSTGEAARHLGVDRSTLGRWVAAGVVTPTRRTIGGQYRWDLDELDRQIEQHEGEQRGRGDT